MTAALQWVEIDRSALVHNIREFRRLIGAKAKVPRRRQGKRLRPRLARDRLDRPRGRRGLARRQFPGRGRRPPGSRPCVAHPHPGLRPSGALEEAVARDLRLIVYNRRRSRGWRGLPEAEAGPPSFQGRDGNHRQGIPLERICRFVSRAPPVRSRREGLSSHFANIEDTTEHAIPGASSRPSGRPSTPSEARHPRPGQAHVVHGVDDPLPGDLVQHGSGRDRPLRPLAVQGDLPVLPQKSAGAASPQSRSFPGRARIAQVKKVPKDASSGTGTYKTTGRRRWPSFRWAITTDTRGACPTPLMSLSRAVGPPCGGRVAMDFLTADITDIPGSESRRR